MNTTPQSKKLRLGTEPIIKLMFSLAIPSIAAQLINILYNIVDRIYIGHITDIAEGSSLALTGVGICLPIITLVAAFALFAGAGGAPLAAIALGKSENNDQARQEASDILSNAFMLLIVFSILLTLFFEIFRIPILKAFGASEYTAGYASDYIGIYLLGTIFVQIAIGLNPFISAQGYAKTAMFSTLIGAVANIILDPIFIFALNMNVKGAAIATIISQALSSIWIASFLRSKKSVLKLAISKPQSKILTKIAALGVSPFIMTSTESAIFIVFNSGLQKFGGDLYVGAMTIMQSLMQLCFVPLQGFTDGVQPAISYNYGAKKYDRVKRIIIYMTLITFAGSCIMSFAIQTFSRFFASAFTDSEQLIDVVKQLLPIYFGAVWIFGIQMSAQRTFVALGKAKTSIIIALLRKVILLIPLALILPNFIGVNGIFWAEPIASTTSAVTSLVLLILTLLELLSVRQ